MDNITTIIRKSFTFNNMHIVRNCTSSRCSQNLHAHTYKLELFLESDYLDNGYMVLDFGILKNSIKELIMSFNNSVTLWNKEDIEVQKFITNKFKRIIIVPISPSAESFARLFFVLIDAYLQSTEFQNNEKNIKLHAIRVHETRTGFAEVRDIDKSIDLKDIQFSLGITDSWSDCLLFEKVKAYVSGKRSSKPIINPKPYRQVIE